MQTSLETRIYWKVVEEREHVVTGLVHNSLDSNRNVSMS